MNTVKITGQNPVYPHYVSTFYMGKRYDVNIKTGKVFFKGVNSRGSFSREVEGIDLVELLVNATKDYLNTK